MSKKIDFTFYAITDRKRVSKGEFISHLEEAFKIGVRAIQIREKDLTARDLVEFIDPIKIISAPYNVRLFLNDRVDIAAALDLDGVHLTERSLQPGMARKILGPNKLIGVSAHDIAGATRADQEGADFIVLGPVASTVSKPGVTPIDKSEFKKICDRIAIPVFALGGITPENAGPWIGQGAGGVAGISIWMDPTGFAGRMDRLKNTLGRL